MTDKGIVYITASSRKEAVTLAKCLVKNRLVACVNILPEVMSWYWWEGKICNEKEFLLIAKTTARLFTELKEEVKVHHSYEVPEIIFVPIQDGSQKYLDWISDVTKS